MSWDKITCFVRSRWIRPLSSQEMDLGCHVSYPTPPCSKYSSFPEEMQVIPPLAQPLEIWQSSIRTCPFWWSWSPFYGAWCWKRLSVHCHESSCPNQKLLGTQRSLSDILSHSCTAVASQCNCHSRRGEWPIWPGSETENHLVSKKRVHRCISRFFLHDLQKPRKSDVR